MWRGGQREKRRRVFLRLGCEEEKEEKEKEEEEREKRELVANATVHQPIGA